MDIKIYEKFEEQFNELFDRIEMNTKAIAGLNKHMTELNRQMKEIDYELQGIRRNSSYLKNIAEILNAGLKK